mgnify:CR=1 FL=1
MGVSETCERRAACELDADTELTNMRNVDFQGCRPYLRKHAGEDADRLESCCDENAGLQERIWLPDGFWGRLQGAYRKFTG